MLLNRGQTAGVLVLYSKTVQPYSLDSQYMQKLEQVRKSAQSNSSNTCKRYTKDTHKTHILRAGTVVHRQINIVSPKPTHYGIYRWFILASVSDWLCSIIIDSRLPIISVSDLVD